MEEFLSSNNLIHLIPIFEDQGITLDILPSLTEDIIKELVPKIGDRVRLSIALRNINNNDALICDIPNQNTPPLSTLIPFETLENNPVAIIETENNNSVTNTETNDAFVTIEECEPEPKKQKIDNNTLIYIIPSETTQSSDHSIGSASTSSVNSDLPFPDQYCLNFCQNIKNLEQLLQADFIGRSVLTKYKAKQCLDNKDRNHICEIVVSHFLNNTNKLNNQCLSLLADKITQLFPTEQKAVYYVSPITKKKSRYNRPEVAKGKLVDKHRNKITALKKALRFDTENLAQNKETSEEISETSRDSKIWLSKNTEPKIDVIKNWKNSYPIRKFKSNTTIEEFYEEWPILKTQLAAELINLDFNENFEEPNCLDTAFKNFFNKLLEIRRNNISAIDETFLHFLDSDDLTNDSKNAIKLYLTASLVPPKGRTRCGKSHWKPSLSESRDGLFIHIKIPGDIEQFKKKRVDFMYSKGLTVQPYVIIVGPNLTNITASYVVINDNVYHCQSVLLALDFCFKAYQILDARYSYESQHLWYLIQWYIYKLKTRNDVRIPFIEDIVM